MTKLAESARLLGVARNAALGVADELRAAFRSAMHYDYKRDLHDIVTAHDRASEERISAFIFSQVPDSTFVGEEGGRQGGGRVTWYVDPIDGTTNFARGIANWCVSIAAVADGELLAGVILDPVACNLFSADRSGAWLNGSPLAARAYPEEERAVLLTSFPNARHVEDYGQPVFEAQAELLDAFLATRNLGSGALQLAHVAAGWADATLGFSTNAWDVAAGILILEQAGGRFVGLDRGTDFAPSLLASDYFGVGRDADYPTLDRVARRVSALTRSAQQLEMAG
jgi:myo-inositol-1(or 4)-monophosphatase